VEIKEPGRSARLNMRISPEALELLKAAAEKQEQDLSAFVLGTAMERARAILIEDQVLRLTPHAVIQLEKALEDEGVVVPQLADLIRRVRGGATSQAVGTKGVSALA
jgi:uncharacterized protein (DUF1778 family)